MRKNDKFVYSIFVSCKFLCNFAAHSGDVPGQQPEDREGIRCKSGTVPATVDAYY